MPRDPYKSMYENRGIELDLRKEIENLLFGALDEVPKGRIGLLRKMKRDDNGNLIQCACTSLLTNEPDKDYYCPKCLGHGFYWEESEVIYYRDDSSFRKYEGKNREYSGDNFYLLYNEVITVDDCIVLVGVDENGKVISPVKRVCIYEILSADPFRADNGRIEYWRIRAKETRNWSVWYGVPTR